MREQLKDLTKQYDKSENDLKALQSVGQIVGEVLKQLTDEKCKHLALAYFYLFSFSINLVYVYKHLVSRSPNRIFGSLHMWFVTLTRFVQVRKAQGELVAL